MPDLEEKLAEKRETLQNLEQKISKFQKAIENPEAFSRHKEYYQEKMNELVQKREDLYQEIDKLENKKEMEEKLYGQAV
ncbi:MAG: hypothetical protein ABEK04_05600 [Candidatus Nanohalobium sp.]